MGALLVALLVGDVPDFGGVEFAVTAGAFGIVILIGWTMQTLRSAHRRLGARAVRAVRAAVQQQTNG